MTDQPTTPPPPPPLGKLVFLSGGITGHTFDVGAGEVTIGRHADQVIQLDADELIVSGAHATIRWSGEHFVLQDCESRNGTLVNGREIREHELVSGDVITFGPGGPTARFVIAGFNQTMSTVEVGPRRSFRRMFRDAQVRVRRQGSHGASGKRRTLWLVFLRLAYRRSTLRTRWTVLLLLLALIGTPIVARSLRTRAEARLQAAMAEFAADFEAGQSELVTNLATVQAAYDSLRDVVDDSRRAIEGNRQFGRTVTQNYSRGVALIVFSWGFTERGGTRWLRYQLDAEGRPRVVMGPDGRPVPDVGFEGEGQIIQRTGTATGFLVNEDGWILTNRHVARPWQDEVGLRDNLQPRFRVLRAYFPPGDDSYALRVSRVSTDPEIDLAVLHTVSGQVDAPVLPMAAPDSGALPGDAVVFIGYPTGVHNLMFRVTEDVRDTILERAGEDILGLAAELARRGLVQPLVVSGTVSDTTRLEVIHTAATTGGGSGGPLIGSGLRVVAIHYAAVQSPIRGDPFRTQRGIQVRHVWNLLPEEALPAGSEPVKP